MLYPICISLLLVSFVSATSNAYFNLFKLNSTSALCLDGSPGAYYLSRTGDPSKIYLEFEGGGWCGGKDLAATYQSCWNRSTTMLGSTNNYTTPKMINEGTLSQEDQNNFQGWTRVLLLYCDGSGHQGTRKQPVLYKNTKLYFRGHNITVEQLDSLEQKIGLFSKASQVVIGGDSAGGLAVFQWTNYIAERVRNGKVWSLPDSGIFLDTYSVIDNSHLYKQQFANLMTLSNVEIDPPVPQCIKQFPIAKQNCMFAENIFRHIKVPLFAIESLYDTYSIANILRIFCVQSASLQYCNSTQRSIIEEYRRNVTNILFEIGSKSQNGFWAPACADHVYGRNNRYFNQTFRIPQRSMYSASISVQIWLNDSSANHRFIDQQQWPSNKPCSGLPNYLSSEE